MTYWVEQAQLGILKWDEIEIGITESIRWFTKESIIETLNPIKKAIYKDNISLWNKEYNEYLIKNKIIENLSSEMENILSNNNNPLDNSLLEYEKYIFSYAVMNWLFSETFIENMKISEIEVCFNIFVKKYSTKDISYLIEKIKIEEWKDKFLILDMGNWKTEKVITPNPDPHMHNDWPLDICYDH